MSRMPLMDKSAMVDRLADGLLDAIAHARLGVGPMRKKPAEITPVVRRRAAGGGRRADVTKRILWADIRRALQAAGAPTGRWRVEKQSGPAVEMMELCWQIVTGEVGKPGECLRDQRRMVAKRGQWEIIP